MPNQIVEMNAWVFDQAGYGRGKLNTGTWKLRLYTNNHTPTPADSNSDYTIASYDTYADITIGVSDFATPAKITDGEYQSASPTYVFPSPTASGSVTIYGWVLTNGSAPMHAFLFNSPVTLTNGGPSLGVQINYQEWAKSII